MPKRNSKMTKTRFSDKKRKLRSGFTTGAAAAAAAKAAVKRLTSGITPDSVDITFLNGTRQTIRVNACDAESRNCAWCVVTKDAGDDPDVTNGADIGARVRLLNGKGKNVTITGGKGVGRVTKPGLAVLPGHAAINPGPQEMIRREIDDCFKEYGRRQPIEVEIFVPDGEALARKTLNARLGIIGGISILGTTGIVRPLSHEAYIATIDSALSVARASGLNHTVMTTGRRSERFAQILWPDWPEEAFIQIGDYFEKSIQLAQKKRFSKIFLAVFFAKAVKMALGLSHTHAAKARLNLEELATWTQEITEDASIYKKIKNANTAREAFGMLSKPFPEVIEAVGKRAVLSAHRHAGGPIPAVGCVIFDYEGKVAYRQDPFEWKGKHVL